jgi:hypothetical protein
MIIDSPSTHCEHSSPEHRMLKGKDDREVPPKKLCEFDFKATAR